MLLPTHIPVCQRTCWQQHPHHMMSVILFLAIGVGVMCPLPCPTLCWSHMHTKSLGGFKTFMKTNSYHNHKKVGECYALMLGMTSKSNKRVSKLRNLTT